MAQNRYGACWVVIWMIAMSLPVFSEAIAISGTVTDKAGKPVADATVRLKKTPITTTTDENGAFTLEGSAPIIVSRNVKTVYRAPRIENTRICFHVPVNGMTVRIAMYNLLGKRVLSLLNKPLSAGDYRLEPPGAFLPQGMYCVAVTIGTHQTILKMQIARHRVSARSLRKISNTVLSLSATAASNSIDTLTVAASGYKTVSLPIASYTGTHTITLEDAYTVSYYRLRVEYVSTSDWSAVILNDSLTVIKARRMALVGQPMSSQTKFSRLGLNQPLADAQAGKVISMTVDFALTPEALDKGFDCSIQKGVAGSVTVRFYSMVNDTPQLLQEITQSSPLDFSVDLSSMKNSSPLEAPMAPVEKMGWAIYYPWYDLNSWNSPYLRDKPATLYATADTLALERQMDQAKSAGIGGFISSWWGPTSDSDVKLKLLLRIAEKKDFKIGIFLETIGDNGPRDENVLYDWLAYFVATYREYPAMMKVDGNKPFILPFCTCLLPFATWQRIINKLHEAGLDAGIMADCNPQDSLFIFVGAAAPGSKDVGRFVRYYSVLADSPAAKIWMPTARPGYDDRLLPDRNGGSFQDRENGDLFRRELNTALDSDPHWVKLYTWNEWWEHTYIEPSVNYGDQYIRIAGEILLPWETQ